VSVVEFSKEEKVLITQKLQRYVATELGFEMGSFDAEFLLDFVSKELGCYFYNRGLYDAQTVVNARFEEMAEAIVVLEKFEPSN
jgi:uncharacterized protein (DUF2164 family)